MELQENLDELAVFVDFDMLPAEDGYYFIIKESPRFSAYRLKLKEHQCDLFFCGNTMILGVGDEPYTFELNEDGLKASQSYHEGGIFRFAFENEKGHLIPIMSIRHNVVSTTLLPKSINVIEQHLPKQVINVTPYVASSEFVAHNAFEKTASYLDYALFELEDKSLLFEVYQFEATDIVKYNQDLKMAFKDNFLRIETDEKYFIFNIEGFQNYNIKELLKKGRGLAIHFIANDSIMQEFNFKSNNTVNSPLKPKIANDSMNKNSSQHYYTVTYK